MHLIASFHAVLVAGVAVLNIHLGPDNDYEHILYVVMAGYFIADYFTYCIGHDPIVYGFHHTVTVLATYRMINLRHWNAFQYASWCTLLELSTPFLQHFRATKSLVSGFLFVLSFFVIRVIFLTWLSYFAYTRKVFDSNLELIIIITFTLLNYVWFVQILQKAQREREKQEEKKRG
jgi:hypothetical protein